LLKARRNIEAAAIVAAVLVVAGTVALARKGTPEHAAAGDRGALLATNNPRRGPAYPNADQASAAAGGFYVPQCPNASAYYVQSGSGVAAFFQNSDAELSAFPYEPDAGFQPGPIKGNSRVKPKTVTAQGQQAWGYEAKPEIYDVPVTDSERSQGISGHREGVLFHSYLTWKNRGSALVLRSKADLSFTALQDLANSCT
jgi:hypothetical protein